MDISALITHEDCLKHLTPKGHPEQVARLEYILDALKEINLLRVSAPMAADDDILRIHPLEYISYLKGSLPHTGYKSLDGDTHISSGSLTAAYRAAGGVLRAIDVVLSGEAKNAFVAVRPPGHHAETQTAMGFCLFGNVALGVKHSLDFHGLKRVAVIDFDVHHGNGTQELLWDESRCLTFTSQQMPLWPGTGSKEEQGNFNNIVNIPLPPGSSGALMREKYEMLVFPALHEFKPELILISAGFDAHEADPLAELNWSTEDFSWLTERICEIASDCCDGRLVSTLEGGYDLEALAESVKAHVIKLCEA
ncbi:MAG: acetoin utilization protein [Marinovum sp.]|nr:acetoin utilization protein [Marinovum sp.]|tara:strand:+ start:3120 stop:4043 length:924 start_codon:yes stop_codon:yes gene_type:complete